MSGGKITHVPFPIRVVAPVGIMSYLIPSWFSGQAVAA